MAVLYGKIAAKLTFLLLGDGRSLAKFSYRLSRRRNAHSRRRYYKSGLEGRRVSLSPDALERGLKSSLSLCGEVTVAESVASSPSTALVRFRLHAWPTVSTYLCPSKVQTAY